MAEGQGDIAVLPWTRVLKQHFADTYADMIKASYNSTLYVYLLLLPSLFLIGFIINWIHCALPSDLTGAARVHRSALFRLRRLRADHD